MNEPNVRFDFMFLRRFAGCRFLFFACHFRICLKRQTRDTSKRPKQHKLVTISKMLLRRLLVAIALLMTVMQSDGCVEDALLCPNGVALSRDPLLNCEFPVCSTDKPKSRKHLKGGKTTAYGEQHAPSLSL